MNSELIASNSTRYNCFRLNYMSINLKGPGPMSRSHRSNRRVSVSDTIDQKLLSDLNKILRTHSLRTSPEEY